VKQVNTWTNGIKDKVLFVYFSFSPKTRLSVIATLAVWWKIGDRMNRTFGSSLILHSWLTLCSEFALPWMSLPPSVLLVFVKVKQSLYRRGQALRVPIG
jgi:hypothetical protein